MPRFIYNQKERTLAIPFPDVESYLKARAELVEAQNETRFDSGMVLSPAEELVNARLIRLRNQEIARYKAGVPFPPALYFPDVKGAIEASPLFPILKVMPKGAVLHLHSSSISSPEALLELTYLDNLYMYTGRAGLYGQLQFYGPGQVPSGWEPVSALRAGTPDFDQQLLKLLTIGPEGQFDPDIWRRFEAIFTRIGGLVSYQPAFIRLYQRALTEYLNDNIQHIEIRSGLGNLYDLEGHTYNAESVLDITRRIL
ncbi:MAG TPA: hypothetical protein VHR47_04610, partial [Bacillota bacterium]|nr:hypothetical protein [Bacillota bacterium]